MSRRFLRPNPLTMSVTFPLPYPTLAKDYRKLMPNLTCDHLFCIEYADSYRNTRSFSQVYEALKNSSLGINHKTCFGYGMIHWVQEPELIGRLLDEGADINMINLEGYTPLALAAIIRDFDVVAALLSYGADPSITDSKGYTPLFHAIESVSIPAASLLIEYETDFSRETIDGDTALSLALENMPHAVTVIAELIKRGADVSSLVTDCERFFYVVNLRSVDAFKPVWDNFDYKEIYNEDNGLLYNLLIRNQYEMFDYVIFSNKLQDQISAFNENEEVMDILNLMSRENVNEGKVIDAIHILLSYGYVPTEDEVTCIYELFGYGDLFKLCLDVDVALLPEVDFKYNLCDIIAKLILHPYLDIREYMDGCFRVCNWSLNYPSAVSKLCVYWYSDTYDKSLKFHSIQDTLGYVRDRRFVDLALLAYGKQDLAKVCLNPIPSLLELSRNKLRHAICKKYEVTNCRQFYSILDKLKLPDMIIDILALRRPIYRVPD